MTAAHLLCVPRHRRYRDGLDRLTVRPSPAADNGGHDPVALWALLPLGMYAVLALAGMRILPATLAAFATALLLALPSASTSMAVLADSVTNP